MSNFPWIIPKTKQHIFISEGMNQWYSSDGKNLILLHNIELFLCPPDYGALIGSKGDSRKSWLISITSANPVVIPTARCCQRWYCTSVCSGDVQRNDRLGLVVAQRSSGVSMILNNRRLCLSGTHTRTLDISTWTHTHTSESDLCGGKRSISLRLCLLMASSIVAHHSKDDTHSHTRAHTETITPFKTMSN